MGNDSELPPQIPQELVDRIIEELSKDKDSLRACALTCQSFKVPSQKGLFHHIKLKGSDSLNRPLLCERFHSILQTSSHIAGYVKDLVLVNHEDGTSWLTEGNSLPSILPQLTNLERIHVSGGLWEASLCFDEMPLAVKKSLLEVIRSPKITHLGLQAVRFTTMDELVETIAVSPRLKSLALFSVEIEEDNHLGSRDPQERLGRTGEGPNQSKLRADLSSLSLFMKDQKPTWLMDWLLGPESSYSLAHLNKFSLIADKTDQLSIVDRVASTSQCLQEMNVTLGFGGIEENYLDTPAQDLSSPYNVDFGFFLSSEFQSSSQAVIDWWCNSLEQSGPNLKLETLNMYVLVEAEDLDFEDFSLGWQRLDGILAGSLRQGDENNGVSLILWIKLMEDAEEEEEEEFQAQTISREILGKLEDAFPMVKAKGMLQVCQMTEKVASYFARFFGVQL